ncbi:MAG: LD-carboxypeptidase [Acidobacteria bacterium]|nr:LD-carboxypeptidase [Acidobacteriota bacterium]
MDRRQFLAAGAALAQPAAGRLLRPHALKPGDTVGLITPATYVSDPDRLALAERTLRYFGLQLRFGRNVRRRAGYLGGTVEERLADLHDFFRDPEVKGIFCIRGGFGAGHLVDRLDYDLIRSHPKVFLGYSDITALHLAIHRRTGLVTFHGPVVLSRFTSYTQTWFRRALFETAPLGVMANPPDSDPLRPAHATRAVVPGRARGPLVGGNLSLVCSLMGTPFEIDTRGRILFLEDTGEEPYSIDRMLTNLRLAGKLEQAAGIVWGECNRCGPRTCDPGFESTFSAGEVVEEILGKLKIPVLSGLVVGHTDDQLTLPMGVTASLDAGQGSLTVEEAATSE